MRRIHIRESSLSDYYRAFVSLRLNFMSKNLILIDRNLRPIWITNKELTSRTIDLFNPLVFNDMSTKLSKILERHIPLSINVDITIKIVANQYQGYMFVIFDNSKLDDLCLQRHLKKLKIIGLLK